jgi:hypothetical protein
MLGKGSPTAASEKTACAAARARTCSASSAASLALTPRLKAALYACSAASAALLLSASATPCTRRRSVAAMQLYYAIDSDLQCTGLSLQRQQCPCSVSEPLASSFLLLSSHREIDGTAYAAAQHTTRMSSSPLRS